MGTPITTFTENTTAKMRSLSVVVVLALVGMCWSLPVAQQAAASPGGQGDQRIFGNLLGAAQGAIQGFTQPQLYNNNFGFGWGNQGWGNQGYGGYYGSYNPYGYQTWG